MARSTNNSLASAMFPDSAPSLPTTESQETAPPSDAAAISIVAQSVGPTFSGEALAQAMLRALSDCLPGILASMQGRDIAPSHTALSCTIPAGPSTFSSVIATGSSASSGNIVVPSFVSTFSTPPSPAFGYPSFSLSLPLLTSPSLRGVPFSSFPTISSTAPVVGKDFVIGPGYSPIPHKLANKITSGQFVELADLLPDNLKVNESETQTFLEGKLVVAPARRRTVEIQDILTWVEAFTIYCLVLCASQPSRKADLSHYKLLVIQTAKKIPWESLATIRHRISERRRRDRPEGLFKNESWPLSITFIRWFPARLPRLITNLRLYTRRKVLTTALAPPSSAICGMLMNAVGPWHCRFRHACEACSGDHRSTSCPYRSAQVGRRSRSPTPSGGKRRRR